MKEERDRSFQANKKRRPARGAFGRKSAKLLRAVIVRHQELHRTAAAQCVKEFIAKRLFEAAIRILIDVAVAEEQVASFHMGDLGETYFIDGGSRRSRRVGDR